MFSFVRHSDRSKFSERTTCLHIHGLSMSPLYIVKIGRSLGDHCYTRSCAALNRQKRNTWNFYLIDSTATISGV